MQNGHNLLRQQSHSQRLIGNDPAFWDGEATVQLVGDGSYATIADADVLVTLYTETASRAGQPPRWIPLLSCVRPPDFGSTHSEPQAGLSMCSASCLSSMSALLGECRMKAIYESNPSCSFQNVSACGIVEISVQALYLLDRPGE